MAIRISADKTLAEVEHITAPKQGQFGEFQSILFRRYDLEGEDAKVWKSLKPEQAQLFKKKQQVYLIPAKREGGKDSWDIELIDAAPPAPARPPVAESPAKYNAVPKLNADQKRAIADYTEEQLSLLRFLWDSVEKKFEDQELTEESKRCIATSLYIQIQRKFP